MATAFKRGKIGSRSLKRYFADNGGAPANGIGATEFPSGVNKTVLNFVNATFAMVDAAGVVAYASKKIYDFPAGDIVILAATANLAITKSSAGVIATFDGDFSLGTVAAAADATLTGTEANIIPSTATPQAVAGVSSAKGRTTASVVFDGTTTPVDLYFNVLVDDADHDVTTTPCNLIFNGTVTVIWASAGDY